VASIFRRKSQARNQHEAALLGFLLGLFLNPEDGHNFVENFG
jgi:hypothetical protein